VDVQRIVETYCRPGFASAWRRERRRHSHFHAGFFRGGGYLLMELVAGGRWEITGQAATPFRVMPEVGDWPLVIFWRNDRERAVLRYCEGDLGVEVFDSDERYRAELERLRREHASAEPSHVTP